MSDKNLKNKLDGYSADFQPGDWDAMEAMLEKEPKRRAFAWWWWSAGAAILAFIAGAGSTALLLNNGNSRVLAEELTEKHAIEHLAMVEPVHFTPVSENMEALSAEEFIGLAKTSPKTTTTTTTTTSNSQPSAKAELKETDKAASAITENTETPAKTAQVSVNEQPKTAQTNVRKGFEKLPMGEWTLEETLLAMNEAKESAKGARGTVTELENESEPTLTAEEVSLGEALPELASNEESSPMVEIKQNETVETSEDETKLPTLAAGPGFWGFLEGGAGLLHTAPNMSGNNLSAKYGLRFGFGYGRFALSSGLIYNAFNYGLDTIICSSTYPYQCPAALEASVKAIEVPIALRIDMVKTDRFRFWAEAGVGMNVKFRENFAYAFDQNVTTTNVPPQPPNTSFTPGNQNDFQGIPIAAETRYLDSPTSLFASGGANRVYWTGTVGLGLTYYPIPRMGLNMSVRYHHSTKRLGDQPRHLQQVGAWMGINYLFGR